MLNMKTLPDRLIEICSDLGLPTGRGRNTALSELLGITTGRVSQLFPKDGSRDPNVRLSEEALRRVVAKGYNADWVQIGKGEKYQGKPLAKNTQTVAPTNTLETTKSPDDVIKAVESLLALVNLPLSVLTQEADKGQALKRITQALAGANPIPTEPDNEWWQPNTGKPGGFTLISPEEIDSNVRPEPILDEDIRSLEQLNSTKKA